MTDDEARTLLLLAAARDVDAPGKADPYAVMRGVAAEGLDDRTRDQAFATLIEAVRDRDEQRAVIATVVLIFGEPAPVAFAWADEDAA